MNENIELLDFYAEWCGPCQMMKPIIEELEKEIGDKVKITKVNVDENQNLASEYEVMSLPTFIIKKDKQIVDKISGEISKSELMKKLV
ncbi:MAG: thioredoxin 1 [Candidatus Berkelbacteria bacterium Licking1014_85]|uniref:Thioredoxin n=1 Tax=Candidatus Berkelbacteria bacterium Licking1014_85 TaxID=2017148 RepID=A0A554LH65_9BACT|nr:MAG: thioredoxin 1 [Candidatus Berkelbacteria bacterium Licking1014_85]